MKLEIMTNGSIPIVLDVYQDFMDFAGGKVYIRNTDKKNIKIGNYFFRNKKLRFMKS